MDEKQIIDLCRQGNPEAFRLIVERYADQMMSLAMNLLGNRQDAEDVCQEAFVKAFRHLHRYNPQQSFRQWLLTILYRRSLDLLRKRKRLGRFLTNWKRWLTYPGSKANQLKFSEMDHLELRKDEFASSLLDGLPSRQRAVLTLWARDGLTSEEIAAILGCRPSTARVQLYLARKKIKTWLESKK